MLTGANGTGLNENVVEAYNFLCLNYEGKLELDSETELNKSESDEIFLFGFSRGAYTVRALVGLIDAVGILKKSKLKDFGKIYALYQDGRTTELDKEIKAKDVKIPKKCVKIKIVGVWDTVGSLGVPDAWFTGLGIHKWMNKGYEFHNPTLNSCKHSFLRRFCFLELQNFTLFAALSRTSSYSSGNLHKIRR